MLFIRAALLVVFLMIPGWACAALLRGELEDFREGERLYIAVSLGVGLVALCAFALALASAYSLPRLILSVGGVSALCAAFAGRRLGWAGRIKPRFLLGAVAVILVALFLFSPPGRTVFGWSDVGVYPDIAAHVEREGGVHMEVPTVREVAPERRDLVYAPNRNPDYPFLAFENKAFFITDFEEGEVVPQFYYLWPSFMAVFASFLGPENMFWAVTAVSVLVFWGLYLLAVRLLGKRWGLAAAVLAALSPLMLYFSRYTTSEMMNASLFLAGSLAFVVYLEREEEEKKKGSRAALLAAFLYSLGFFCRVDFLLVLPLFLLLFAVRRLTGKMTASDKWFCAVLATGAALSLAAAYLFTRPYFYATWGSMRRLAVLWALPSVVLLLVVFAAPPFLGDAGRFFRRRGVRRFLSAALFLVIMGGFSWLYWIRPSGGGKLVSYGVVNDIKGPAYAGQTMVRWGWYFSIVGLLLLFLGYFLWLAGGRRFAETALGTVGLAYTFFYGWNLRCTPLHILCMRRLVPVILPLGMIMICFALARLEESGRALRKSLPGLRWRGENREEGQETIRDIRLFPWLDPAGKILAGGLLFYLLLYSAHVSIPVLGLQEGGNQLEVCREIASEAGEDAIVLMDYHLGDLFGPPLRCFFGVENAWLMDNEIVRDPVFEEILEDFGEAGSAYLLWRPGMSGSEIYLSGGRGTEGVGRYQVREIMLEKSFDHRPSRKTLYSYEVWLVRIEENP